MAHALTEPWTQGILRHAFAEVALLGAVGGALGCWLVLYELSYGAESLAHSLFPGLVFAALAGLPLLVGGLVGVVGAALAIGLVARAPGVGRDTAVAIVVTGLFGAGVLLALSRASPPGLQGLLFGDLLGVSGSDLALAAVLAGVVAVVLRLAHGRLLIVGFDRSTARAFGASPARTDAVLLVLLALAVVVAVQGLGNLLVVAVLIGPAATARLVTHRMVPMMAVAGIIAVLGGIAGLYVSFYAATAAGASVAALYVVGFVLAEAAVALRRRPTLGAP